MLTKFKHQRLLFIQNLQPMYSSSTHFKTQQSSNDYISTLCKKSLFKQALDAFDFIQSNTHFQLTLSSYARLIFACSSLKSLEHGVRVHNHLMKSGPRADVILHNHIINMYGKCGLLVRAREVFDAMPDRNVVSWTSIIISYSENLCEGEAVELYIKMLHMGLMPDQFALGSIIRACSGTMDVELGKQLHCQVIKSECGSHQIVQNALIAMYTKFDSVVDAVMVFVKIVRKDLISWGSIIAGFAQLGYEQEALSHFKEMISLRGYFPNEFIFGSVFSACGSLLQLEYGRQSHALSIKYGLGRDPFCGCSLSDMYAKCQSLESAKKAFYEIDKPDVVAWNAIIAGFAYSDDVNESMGFFSNMRLSGMKPDQITLCCLLCACSNYKSLLQGQQMHTYILKTGLDSDVQVCNTLLSMYARCSDFVDGFKVFEGMNESWDSVSWNAILTACIQHDQFDEVFRLIILMQDSDTKFDQVTLSTVISVCASLAMDTGKQVHGHAVRSGLSSNVSVTNSLIDMYAKCGTLDDARKLFDLLSNPDAVSWSSLIVGYAQFGYGKEALELFREMLELGVKPNHVTFVGVLSACSRIGLLDEGLLYYKTMEIEHGIVPTKEHCSCMVDLLARAGHLEEAERFITQMPVEPDIIVWKTVLAACRVHGNVEVGKRAAENIMNLDPFNPAAYVLLCNIYASSGCWDDVARLRRLMKSRGVRKDPGQSWIKVEGRVHVFSVEDRSHFKTNEIYMMLGNLFLQISDAGYMLRRKFASNNM